MSAAPDPPPGEPSGESSPDGPPAPERESPPRIPTGLRVVLYLLSVYLVLRLGSALLLALLDPDRARALVAAAEDVAAREELLATIPFGLLLLIQVLLAPLLALLTWFFLRRFDRAPLAAIGLRWPADGGRQTVIASAAPAALAILWLLMTSMAAELRFVDWAEPFATGAAGPWLRLLLYLLGFLVVAALEEMIFRGYVYTALRERLSWVNAAGVTSVLFTLVHLANPDVGEVALINTFLIALLLATLRETTGSLWGPAICHGVWNFTVGCVLSLPVSGIAVYPLFTVEVGGDPALTGGAYGPEGSLLLTALLLPLVAVLAYVLVESGGEEENGGAVEP